MGAAPAPPSPVSVDVPPSDARLYRRLTLPNGMGVLLIHDPAMAADVAAAADSEEGGDRSGSDDDGAVTESDTDASGSDGDDEDDDSDAPGSGGKGTAAKKAAAAVAVGVGSLCDPPEMPGLAHYLEHMLFMGSEKYPDENE